MRGGPQIWIENRQRKFKLNVASAKSTARLILEILGKEKAALSLLFVNDRAIQKFNQQFRKINKPTDVLSFPMGVSRVHPGANILGDIVISLETAQRQAESLGHSLKREVVFLLIHGVLHLLGWDHERSAQEAKKMYKKQRDLLAMIEK
ncbi:MAG: rRNA maturation RNase YbeY [Nitrospirae bacterium]|nr:rRNA maturation RNase YbeY [Nitrospirota bacterium]MBI3352006.1 rRNA maturation RNase YbeY [Nitrospirota bacterium]